MAKDYDKLAELRRAYTYTVRILRRIDSLSPYRWVVYSKPKSLEKAVDDREFLIKHFEPDIIRKIQIIEEWENAIPGESCQ